MSEETTATAPREPIGAATSPVRPWLPKVLIAAVVVLVLAITGTIWFYVLGNQPTALPSRRSMAETALKGIEAVIIGDADALASISDATMTAQITPDFANKLKMSGLVATFSDPKWNGDSFEVLVTTGQGDSILLGGPVPDGKYVVLFRTMGKIGATTGGVTLSPAGSAWEISAFAAGRSAPATGSVSPTATPSATSTP